MSNYNELLKDIRWINISNLIKERDGQRCRVCNSNLKLNVHHRIYRGRPWEARLTDLITLCNKCHDNFHHPKFDEKPIAKKTISKPVGETAVADTNSFFKFLRQNGYKRVIKKLGAKSKVLCCFKCNSVTITIYKTGSIVSSKGVSHTKQLVKTYKSKKL